MGRIVEALGALFGPQEGESYDTALVPYEEEEDLSPVDIRSESRLREALGRQKTKTLGLPRELTTDQFIATALVLENLVDRDFSFREEQQIILWIRETDNLLAQMVATNNFNLRIHLTHYHERVQQYFRSHLGGDPFQFIKLQCYSVILWLEANKGLSNQEGWIYLQIGEFLGFLEDNCSYGYVPEPLGNPGSAWSPTSGLNQKPQKEMKQQRYVIEDDPVVVQSQPPPPPPQQQQQRRQGPYNTEMA